jgi:hypothetical protein
MLNNCRYDSGKKRVLCHCTQECISIVIKPCFKDFNRPRGQGRTAYCRAHLLGGCTLEETRSDISKDKFDMTALLLISKEVSQRVSRQQDGTIRQPLDAKVKVGKKKRCYAVDDLHPILQKPPEISINEIKMRGLCLPQGGINDPFVVKHKRVKPLNIQTYCFFRAAVSEGFKDRRNAAR